MTLGPMAVLTPTEFGGAMRALVDHFGVERLRDKLGNMGAFKQRRGLNTADALTDRIYRLSGGLRMQVPATLAFSVVWGELLQAKLGEEGEKELEKLAEGVNACLDPKEQVVEGKEQDLDAALTAYREALAGKTGPEIASIDMLLKAVPAVATRLRAAAS